MLLGGSGSGKTTLLRAIGGFVRPDAGRIVLDGADLSALPPHKRPVNTMFQSYALFPHMSVAANIGFGLRQQGVARAETQRRIEAMLALVRLQGFGRRRPASCPAASSSAWRWPAAWRRIRLLLLLDEPLSALDEGLRDGDAGRTGAAAPVVGDQFRSGHARSAGGADAWPTASA